MSHGELARFVHDGTGQGLRLQCFVLPRDAEGRLASLRIEGYEDAWLLPGEMMLLNESPMEAAERVAETYFTTPLEDLSLRSVESWPPEDPDDGKWYLVFVFDALAPEGLEGTPDTLELDYFAPDDPPTPLGFDHASIWQRVTGVRAGLL